MYTHSIARTQAKRNTTFFSGEVSLQSLVAKDESQDIEVQAVFFSAGARTKPHTHGQDQILFIYEGQGIVATETEKRNVHAGDIVTIPAGEWHWHGATLTSPMCHLSIMKPGVDNWNVEMKNWEAGYEDTEGGSTSSPHQ